MANGITPSSDPKFLVNLDTVSSWMQKRTVNYAKIHGTKGLLKNKRQKKKKQIDFVTSNKPAHACNTCNNNIRRKFLIPKQLA